MGTKEMIYVDDEKISIFKIPKKSDVGNYAENENRSSFGRANIGIKFQERRPHQKVEENRTEEKIKMGRIRPAIKEKRSKNKPDLRGLDETILYQGKVDNEGNREKHK